ncbi:serine/threonine-protein kinase [Anaerolineales bacterium HSG6]|nr:serine/threonine-protein kinase [Anaerolineales bacterium HSG6]
MQPETNIILKNYRLDNEIGRDELTTIYRGYDLADNGQVAVKIVAPQFTFDQQFIEQFKQNVETINHLTHANIIQVYGVWHEDDKLYTVQELAQGHLLSDLLKREGALPPKRMVKIVRQIGIALDYAHQQDIIHGDLSADCVYVALNDQVMVANFGQTQAMTGTGLVKQGYPIGTPETLAPEIVHGQGPSRHADLYALGILCYQMLTTKPPFTGTLVTMIHGHGYETPRPLHLLNPSISVNISRTIEQMLAKRIETRYKSGAEFTRALSNAIDSTVPHYSAPVSVKKSPTVTDPVKVPSPYRKQLWFAGAIMAVVLSFVFSSSLGAVSIWQIAQSANPVAASWQQPANATAVPAAIKATPTHKPTFTPTTTPTPLIIKAEPSPLPTEPSTVVNIPTLGNPTLVNDSPFTNLQLAQSISRDDEPEQVGTFFTPEGRPIYLFFDYRDIAPGTSWSHRWTWADSELATYQAIWPDNYGRDGMAWVFYHPPEGYSSGPYSVNLIIEGRVVSTATFVVEP